MYITDKEMITLKHLLNYDSPECIANIAENMNVSVRTFRKYLKGVSIIVSEYGGNVINYPNESIFLEADFQTRERLLHMLEKKALYITDPRGRRNYIIDVLFETAVPYTIQLFASDLGVSKNVIINDIIAVEEWFKRFDIKVVKKPGAGLTIEGAEMNLRQCMAFFNRTYEKPWMRIKMKLSESEEKKVMGNVNPKLYMRLKIAYPKISLVKIMDVLLTIEKKYTLLWTPEARSVLLSQLCVLIDRQCEMNSHHLPKCEEDQIPLSTLKCANELLQSLSEKFNLTFAQEEVVYVSIDLLAADRQYPLLNQNGEEIDIYWKKIATKVIMQIATILKKKEISKDKQLHKEITFYLRTMSYRVKYNIFIENIFLEEFKKYNTSLFGACWSINAIIENYLGININENEIIAIALLIGSAIRRNDENTESLKALVVCLNGMGMHQYIREMIEMSITGLNIVKVTSYSEALAELDTTIADIILCIDCKILDNRSIQITMPLTRKNIHDIELNKKNILTCKKQNVIENFSKFIKSDLIWLNFSANSMPEAIQKLCESLCNKGYVSENYAEKVIMQERLSSTYIGKGIAIPHALGGEKDILRQGVAIVRLNKSISWSNKEEERVDLFFLLILRFSNIKHINYFFKEFYSLLKEDNMLIGIKNASNYEEIIQLLTEKLVLNEELQY